MKQIHDIYDRASKRCLSLSKRGTILLINGLYEKDYPLDSQVDYHWTEHEDDDLKLIVLIPFQLLRLRKEIEKERTSENLEKLKELIQYDIIETIQENVAAENLTVSEGRKLKQVALQLYRHIYEKYDEMERTGVNKIIRELSGRLRSLGVSEEEIDRISQKK